MLRRRDFLKHSAAVATAASTGILSGRAAAQQSAQQRVHVDFVVFDDEVEDSIVFAHALARGGARTFAVRGDVGRLWFGELGHAFKAGNVIAGLTAHSELLICAAFAREQGARLRYEGSHDCRGSEVLTHSLRLPLSEQPFSSMLAAADTTWPIVLASRMGDLAACSGSLHEDRCRTVTKRSTTHPGSLFSWVIA